MLELIAGLSFHRSAKKCQFNFFVCCLRFDDYKTRKATKKDNFSSIINIWNNFISSCGMNYAQFKL